MIWGMRQLPGGGEADLRLEGWGQSWQAEVVGGHSTERVGNRKPRAAFQEQLLEAGRYGGVDPLLT